MITCLAIGSTVLSVIFGCLLVVGIVSIGKMDSEDFIGFLIVIVAETFLSAATVSLWQHT